MRSAMRFDGNFLLLIFDRGYFFWNFGGYITFVEYGITRGREKKKEK